MSAGKTSVAVTLPISVQSDLQGILSAEFIRHEYHHEICVVEVFNQKNLGLRSGDPVVVTANGSSGHGPETFIGYFDHLKDHLNVEEDARLTKLVFVGPTWYMQQKRQKTWKNMTISGIARAICAKYNLTIDCENTTLRLTLHQAGESDWEFLCRIAKTYGYLVYPKQTIVHFITRTRDLERKSKNAPYFSYGKPGDAQPTQIYKFEPTVGDSPAVSNKKVRVMQTVDPVTGKIISAYSDGGPVSTSRRDSTSGIFQHFDSGTVAQSAADLTAKVQGARDTDMWTYRAETELLGQPNAGPGDVYYLDGLDDDWSGYWTVISAKHKYDSNFTDVMEVCLGTNSLGAPVTGYVANTTSVIPTTQRVPTSSYKLVVPPGAFSVALNNTRATSANPIHWQGTPASLDPLPPEKRIPKASLKRIRHNRG